MKYRNICSGMTISLTILFLFKSVIVISQSGHATRKDAENIKATELIVIIDSAQTAYNNAIRNAIEKYWTYSKFRFVPESQKDLYCTPGYTVLGCSRVEFARSLRRISIVFPGRNGCLWDRLEMKAYSYISFDPEKINGQAIRAVQFIQNYLNVILQKGIGEFDLKALCSSCNQGKETIRKKMLLINNSDIEAKLDDSLKIARYYKHPFMLTGRENISNEMIKQKSDVAYVMNFIDDKGTAFRLVVQAKDSKIIYCEYAAEDQSLLFGKNNFKDISH